MIAMATIKLKLTMMDARLSADAATFSFSCDTAVSRTMRWVRGANPKPFMVTVGTNSTAPNSSAAIAAYPNTGSPPIGGSQARADPKTSNATPARHTALAAGLHAGTPLPHAIDRCRDRRRGILRLQQR